MGTPGQALDEVLLQTAATQLRTLGPLLAHADAHASVSGRSRALCAGLACLAQACYVALGGRRALEQVGEAAAMLSLLTKIDDQVIDALAFHGGPLAPHRARARLDARTRAFLAPTLQSIRDATPATSEPRCVLAATLGQRLRALAGAPDRLADVIDTIALGWEVQVRAVRLLSSDPCAVDPAAIDEVTADISGAWLLMITMIGELPDDAARPIDIHERAAFFRYGLHIQTADAFADLHKDTADGLVASRPGVLLAGQQPSAWRRALCDAQLGPLVRGMVEADIDLRLQPHASELDMLAEQLAGLGMVATWLRWILGFLSWRWLASPLCPRVLDETALDRLFPDALGRALGRGWASGWTLRLGSFVAGETGEGRSCSAR